MTTVAADHRSLSMVGDSKCTSGDIWSPMTKVFAHKGELIGISGDVRQATRWLKWYTGPRRGSMPKLLEYEALVLRKDGLFHVTSDGFEMRVEQGFYAIGSGAMAALALMTAGHSTTEAVEIACRVDPGSGGDLQVHKLEP